MSTKDVTTYFLCLHKSEKDNFEHLTQEEIQYIFDTIKNKTTLEKDGNLINSRYVSLNGQSYFISFHDNDSNIPNYKDCITGIFAKDRKKNYPYQTDEHCNFEKIHLNNDKNLITERTYFIIYKPLSTILWVSNRNVSTFKLFKNYINTLLKNFNLTEIDLSLIANKRTESQFENALSYREISININENSQNLINLNSENLSTFESITEFNKLKDNNFIKKYQLKIRFEDNKERNKETIKSFIRNMWTKHKVTKAHVKIDFDDRMLDLDLLDSRLIISGKIEYNDKYIDTLSVFDLLLHQLNENKTTIKEALVK